MWGGIRVLNYFLSEEQQMIKELAAQIAREKVRPAAAELDEREEFPREILKGPGPVGSFRGVDTGGIRGPRRGNL